MRERKIVVTGAAGFIGSAVRRELEAAGCDVLAVDRAESAAGARFHHANLADPATLFPPGHRDEEFVLVHLAWLMTRTPAYAEHIAHVGYLGALLDHWAERGLRRVVVAGSAEEYGSRAGVLDEEGGRTGELSAYGYGKHAACELARSWSARHSVPVSWLRPFIVYGPGQRGNMLVPYALRMAESGEPAKFSDGVQERDFVHVDDVAGAFASAARAEHTGFRAINVGTGEAVRVADVLAHVMASIRPRPAFELGAIPRRPGEPMLQVAKTDVARDVLGWRATIGWRDGLTRTIAATLPPERLVT